MDWIGQQDIEGRRRVPKQARSLRRYEAILDAASEQFAELGFEATTMEAIAERAQTSIGSVYQFFAHKEAVYEAMVERLLAREEQLFEQFTTEAIDFDAWESLVEGLIDGFAELSQADAGYRALLRTPFMYARVEWRAVSSMERFTKVSAELLGELAPHLSKRRRHALALTATEVVTGLLFAAQRQEPKMAKILLGEAKHVVRAYIRDAIEVES